MRVNKSSGEVVHPPDADATYEHGINGLGDKTFAMSELDKLFLKRFGLVIVFPGTLDKKNSLLHCTHGFIICTKFMCMLTSDPLEVTTLLKYGSEIMHYHISRKFDSLGFTSTTGMRNLIKTKDIDHKSIARCNAVSCREFQTETFLCLQADNVYSIDEAKKLSSNAILFVRCALKAYYGEAKSMYKKYIQRGIKIFEDPMDKIRMQLLNNKDLKLTKKQKAYLHAFYRLYFESARNNKDYETRQKELVNDITSNRKPKPKRKKKKGKDEMIYLGEEFLEYETGAERDEIREFLKEKQIKLNWHTVELVNKEERDKNNPLSPCSIHYKVNEHWVGTSKVFGKDLHFLVTHDFIPENYKTVKGELFSLEWFQMNNQKNTPYPVPNEVIVTMKKIFEEHKEGATREIRLSIDRQGRKSWEGKCKKGVTYKKGMTEEWLRENFEKYYPSFFEDIMTEADVWHEVPVGGKLESNLPKIEDDAYLPIYLENEHKCAFTNMANALYEIYDYEAAKFFEENIYEHKNNIIPFLNDSRGKTKENDFKIAIRLFQSMFGYKLVPLKKTDKLKTSSMFGDIKYVTLLPSLYGYKHVMSIVGDKILDSTNQKN